MAYVIHINGFIGDAGFFGGDSFTLKNLNDFIASMPATESEVNIIINSGGGYVTEGFAIHDRLATLTQRVNTEVIGIGGSIATVIAQAPKSQGKGGKRKMTANADYFIHNPSWTPQSPDPLEADELQRLADDLKASEEKILDFYVGVTGTDKTELKAKMDEAVSISAADAKSLGFIDEIITNNIQATTLYKFAAHVTKTISPMTAIEGKLKAMFQAFKNEISEMIAPATTVNKVTAENGNAIYFDGTLATGIKVFSDEKMETAQPDGELTVDGKTVKVIAGAISEIVEPGPAKTDLDVANEKIAALEAQLAAKETESQTKVEDAVKAKETELTATFNEKFTAFQSKFFTGDKLNPEFQQIMKGDNIPSTETQPTSPLEAYLKRQKENSK